MAQSREENIHQVRNNNVPVGSKGTVQTQCWWYLLIDTDQYSSIEFDDHDFMT